MTPYYEQDGITIIHGDCREFLPTLDPGSVDLVLTDPPYGMGYHSGWYTAGNPHMPLVGDDAYPIDVIELCTHLVRVACMAFCRWDNLRQIMQPDSCLAWIKNNWTAGDLAHDYARQWEAVAVWNGPGHAWRNGRPSDVIVCDRVPPTALTHPTEKPLTLMQRLLRHHVGESVLDPFMGSGTTLVAAKLDGRKAIGVEIEERYCEIAARRLAQGVFEFDKPEATA